MRGWPRLPEARGHEFASTSYSLLAKIVAAPLVAMAWLTATRLVLAALGVEGYAVYAIVAGLAMLLPFADLGTGAALIDAMSKRGEIDGEETLVGVLITSWRTLTGMAIFVTVFAGAIAASGLGTRALGVAQEYEWGVFAAVVIFALALPVGVAPRLLIGGGLTHISVLFQALSAVLMCLVVLVAMAADGAPGVYFAAPFVGMFLSNALALGYASKRLVLPLRAVCKGIFVLGVRGAKVRHIAGPMFVISLLVPIAYQSDRIILSHTSSVRDVAEYSIAFQVFSPLLGLVSTAGVSLWPIFAAKRSAAGTVDSKTFRSTAIAFASLGAVLATLLFSLGPILADFAADGQVVVGWGVWTAFAALLFLQAATYPIAMLLTDAAGLRFQAGLHVPALVLNVAISIVLSREYGAIGPVVGSVVATAAILVLPQCLRLPRYLTRTTAR